MKTLLGIASLLLSTALLLTGHGMQLTLLPLRAVEVGMPATYIGISASAYFLGFVAGCFGNPYLVARVGHIRAFAVLAAVLMVAILSVTLSDDWLLWSVLRFVTGLAMCGLYTVIESWLNSQAGPESRGSVLAIYTVVTLTAMTGGQFLIAVGPVSSAVPFIVAVICMALAILPVGVTRRMAPEPVPPTHSGFLRLLERSRTAFAGALLSGLVAGSFWALGAVFAAHYGETQFDVTLFMSAGIAGGAVAQYPVGWISDRLDRRKVLVFLTIGIVFSAGGVALSVEQPWFLGAVAVFGACAMPLYALSLATAADVSEPSEFVSIGTTVLLLNALGAAFAPLLLGQLMLKTEPTALFWAFSALCGLFALYFLLQLRTPRTIEVEEQLPFGVAANEAAPMAFEMDPRTQESEVPPEDDTPAAGN